MNLVRIEDRVVCVEAGSAGFAETVVLFGGTPNSRLFRPPDPIAASLGVQLITIDRPGYGGSSSVKAPDWTSSGAQTVAVLDELNIDCCRLVGWSAGAGHAWHGAAAIGERCQGLTIVSGLCSIRDDRLFRALPADSASRLRLLRKTPIALRKRMLRWALTPTADRAQSGPSQRISEVVEHASTDDAVALARSADRAMLEADAAEAFTQGVEGWLADALLLTQSWSADVADDLALRVIHGGADSEVGIASGEAIADLADVELHVVDGGHYWILDNWATVLGLW